MAIDEGDRRPAYVQIADDLREQIRLGRLKPGDKMRARKDMAEEYGVAGETVRRAQDELAKEGLIGARSTRGIFVLKAPGEPEPSEEFLQLLDQLAALTDRVESVEEAIASLRRGDTP